MTITTTTHLNFDGDARAALEFYAAAFGTTATMATYGDTGASDDPAWGDRVVWGQVQAPSGIRVMAFDVWPHQPWDQGSNAFYVYLSGDDAAEVTAVWQALLPGAEVRQPLGPAAWSSLAGQLRDRFGVIWALDVQAGT